MVTGGIHVLGEVLVHMEHEALALDGDVLDGVVPLGVIVGVGAQIQADALLIQCHASQGHIVLPADQGTHGAPGGVHRGEVVPVGIAPDDALRAGGLQLPVVAQQRTVGPEDHVGAVQRAVVAAPLRIADGDVGPRLLRRRADAVGVCAGAEHGVVVVDLPVVPTFLGAAAYGEAVGQAIGIAGDQRFGEHDQLRAVFTGLADLRAHLVNGGVLVEHHRGGLYQRHAQLLLQVFHRDALLVSFRYRYRTRNGGVCKSLFRGASSSFQNAL